MLFNCVIGYAITYFSYLIIYAYLSGHQHHHHQSPCNFSRRFRTLGSPGSCMYKEIPQIKKNTKNTENFCKGKHLFLFASERKLVTKTLKQSITIFLDI